jgi:mono/diheme cytochrome c family protein
MRAFKSSAARRLNAFVRLLCVPALCLAALSGCEKGLHEMYDQAKYKPLTPTQLFDDGNSSRPQVPGSVPYSGGALAGTSSGRNARLEAEAASATPSVNPLPIDDGLLERGREQFNIFCAPCHSRAGDGDGMVARRGFPSPPSYHLARLRDAPDSHFYDVISQGYGAMYPYADRIAPEDRWAIVAYIRALQLSQHAPSASLDAEDRVHLAGGAR